MADLGRRRFLAGTGLVGLAAGCRPGKDPYAPQKPAVPIAAGVRPGSESFVLSTCGLCDAGCGIRVRVVDGRAVKIEGNPDSPVNRGGLCARGAAGLELLYHANRVRGPMRRHGRRGGNRWQPIAWDEAIAELGDRLGRLQATRQAPGLVLIDGEPRGTTHALWSRFMAAMGSPNHIGHGATGRAALLEPVRTMTGTAGVPGYDFERAGCVLLVGTGPLESSPQAIHLARALAGAARPRLLCLSPRLPATAALVDEWLAVNPGQASAVLLGLVHVLLRDRLADESVLDGARGAHDLRAVVTASYSPAQVAALAGVSAARIETLARELAANRPSVVVVDEETKDSTATGAALVLHALLSSLGGPGGMLLDADALADLSTAEPATPPVDVPALDGRAAGEASRMLAIPEAILSGEPYPVEVLLLHYSNPAFSKPDGKRWAQAIAKVPFVVSFSPILDESAARADLVLPDQTFFERWDVVAPARATGVVSLRQPVVRPLTQAMQTGDVILRLAAALGGKVAQSLPWKTHHEAVVARLQASCDEADDVLEQLGDKGVCKVIGRRPMDKDVRERDAAGMPVTGGKALVDVTPAIPRKAPVAAERPFPFVLCPFRDQAYAEGGFRELPWLAELPSPTQACGDQACDHSPWSGYVEISRQDAGVLAVEDGAWVAVTSPVGRVELRARVHAHIKAGVLGLRLGGWGRAVGDSEGTPARLLMGTTDAAGNWQCFATPAKVEKLG